MRMDASLQFGVPEPFVFEAPSSWICRLALAQGCTSNEMLRFLQPASHGRYDLEKGPQHVVLDVLHAKVNLPARAFVEASFVLDVFGNAPKLMTATGRPRFRYCPMCLFERPTAYLDIHWRYADWRHCLFHQCELEDRCMACGAWLVYPHDMVASFAGRSGHASQRRCQDCASDLAKTQVRARPLERRGVLTELEQRWLWDAGPLLVRLGARYSSAIKLLHR